MQIDREQLAAYFSFLSNNNSNEIFTVCYMDAKSVAPLDGRSTIFGTAPKIIELTELLHRKNEATLHVVLNYTNDKGRKSENITAPRCLVVDLDRQVNVIECQKIITELSPHLVVQSSEGKYHFYWKVGRELPLQTWRRYQLAFAARLGGDMNLDQVNHILRAPGCPRHGKSGGILMPTIVHAATLPKDAKAGETLELKEKELIAKFPWVTEWYEKGLKIREKANSERNKAISSGDPTKAASVSAATGAGRNNTLYTAVKMLVGQLTMGDGGEYDVVVTEKEALEYGVSFNQKFGVEVGGPLPMDEVKKTCRSGYEHGIQLWNKRLDKIKRRTGVSSGTAGSDPTLEASHADPAPTNSEESPEAQPTRLNLYLDQEPAESALAVVAFSTDGTSTQQSSPQLPPLEPQKQYQQLQHTHFVPYINGHAAPHELFSYNYEDRLLVNNRWTDHSVYARAVQRFGGLMISISGRLFAFNSENFTWKPQSGNAHHEIGEFARKVGLDVTHDPLFVAELGSMRNKKGELVPDERLIRKAQEKYMSQRMYSSVVTQLLNSVHVKTGGHELFDADPHLFFAKNGVIDLRNEVKKGVIRAARAEDYLLARSGVAFNPAATCVGWKKFLAEIFSKNDGPEEMIAFMQELFGYTISGQMNAQKIFCHYGSACNGKSKLLSALKRIAGGYGTFIDPDQMNKTKNGNATAWDRFGAKLEGHRLIIVDDIDTSGFWNESFLKELTGAEVRARAEYQTSRTISNRAKLHLGLNAAPKPESESEGILRRLCIIPYNRVFSSNMNEGNRLDKMIESEAEGILVWAAEGYRRLQERGYFEYPEETLAAVAEYKQDHFVVQGLLRGMYAVDEDQADFAFSIDIADEINQRLPLEHKKVSSSDITRMCRVAFEVDAEMRWNPMKQYSTRGFWLRRIEPKSNKTKDL